MNTGRRVITKYLVVRLNGDCRIIATKPSKLKLDEYAFQVNMELPGKRAIISGSISLDLPNPPDGDIEAAVMGGELGVGVEK